MVCFNAHALSRIRQTATSQYIRSSDNRNLGEPVMNTVKESSSHLSEQDWDGVHSVAADEKKPSMSSYNITVNKKINFIVLI